MLDNKTKIFACAVIEEELRAKLPDGTECEVLDFGLHRSPELLKEKLQELIDKAAGYETIVLAFGLCGMAMIGLHSDTATLVVPRADDCIAFFLGSRAAYLEEQREHPGSLFLSKGWIEGKIDDTSPTVKIYERLLERYGPERAKRMISVYEAKQPLRHYKRLAFISTSAETGLDAYKDIARERAANLGLHYDEIQGSTAFMDKIAKGEWDGEFIIVPPGRPIGIDDFWQDAEHETPPSGFWA